MRRIGVYLADQDWQRTRSKGIYRYARGLVRNALMPLDGVRTFLLVSRSNCADLVPEGFPPDQVVTLVGRCRSGLLRLISDQFLAGWWAARLDLNLLHFPKGFVPLLWHSTRTVTATMHDAIPFHYLRSHPGYFSPAHLRYLRVMMLNSLRRCRGIMTDSAFSAGELRAFAAAASLPEPEIAVCPLASEPVFLESRTLPVARLPNVLLHFGSPHPHKRTREAFSLFDAFNRRSGGSWRLRVVGLSEADAKDMPRSDAVRILGVLSDKDLLWEMRQACALLLPSEVEGFGLPAIEAWSVGTPVCYTDGGALREVLAGIPGHMTDMSQSSFEHALQEVLSLSRAEVESYRDKLHRRFDPAAMNHAAAAKLLEWAECA